MPPSPPRAPTSPPASPPASPLRAPASPPASPAPAPLPASASPPAPPPASPLRAPAPPPASPVPGPASAPPPPARAPGPASFRRALASAPLAADGAMGTQLYARGFGYDVNYEGLNLARPDVVREIHENYVAAGADVLEANTFGANRVRLERHGLGGEVGALNRAALRLAREAARGAAFVVGALGPTGLALAAEADRRRADHAFREQAAALAAAGADALLVETMIDLDELCLAVAAARAEAPGLPVLAQASVDARLALRDGTPLAAAGARLRDLGADALGVNCGEGPAHALLAAEQLAPLGLPLTAMPNAGLPRRDAGRLVYPAPPEAFGALAARLFALGVALVGGCCGTTPAHVRAVARAANPLLKSGAVNTR